MSWDSIKATVAKAAPLLGGALGGPAGGAVGTLIAGALGVEDDPEQIARALAADPEAAAKLRALEREQERELRRMVLEAETARLGEINRTIRAEAQADDAYVRRWRPTFGYAVAFTWIAQMLGIVAATVYAVVGEPEHAGEIINAVGQASAALATQWSVALAVLGISVSARSRDKRLRAGQDGRGVLDRLVERVAGGERRRG